MWSSVGLEGVAEPLGKLRFRESGIRREGTVYACEVRDPFSNNNTEPINTRGWTFQERFLSTRALEYASRQVRWTCYHCLSDSTQQSSPDPERIDHFTDGWRNYTSSEEAEILIENMELLKESQRIANLKPITMNGQDDRTDPINRLMERFYKLVQ